MFKIKYVVCLLTMLLFSSQLFFISCQERQKQVDVEIHLKEAFRTDEVSIKLNDAPFYHGIVFSDFMIGRSATFYTKLSRGRNKFSIDINNSVFADTNSLLMKNCLLGLNTIEPETIASILFYRINLSATFKKIRKVI